MIKILLKPVFWAIRLIKIFPLVGVGILSGVLSLILFLILPGSGQQVGPRKPADMYFQNHIKELALEDGIPAFGFDVPVKDLRFSKADTFDGRGQREEQQVASTFRYRSKNEDRRAVAIVGWAKGCEVVQVFDYDSGALILPPPPTPCTLAPVDVEKVPGFLAKSLGGDVDREALGKKNAQWLRQYLALMLYKHINQEQRNTKPSPKESEMLRKRWQKSTSKLSPAAPTTAMADLSADLLATTIESIEIVANPLADHLIGQLLAKEPVQYALFDKIVIDKRGVFLAEGKRAWLVISQKEIDAIAKEAVRLKPLPASFLLVFGAEKEEALQEEKEIRNKIKVLSVK